MTQPRFAEHEEVIAKAELSIKDSDHRAELLQEMWDSLGVKDEFAELLFQEATVEEQQAAEREMLDELNRQREHRPKQTEEGRRPRRPAIMRGLVI
ncbi:LcrG family type III secretion system chaperone [Aeromonas veronii]|uniref:LcrG family type III secretion system chaperone n=1 Tax=Aeromonas veronii TaxID=654 RepID=UPI00111A513A|nr:LcrG family type III secretion system chaperone [Aeromonas veronii]MCC0090707.1 LcrG family type III secretion system chaperone [Aeromonas veronii]QLH67753.1 LcrG family type III secretion system chaperone [Aeromonas veronii]TNJ06145.1 type III secretion protein LcrG [Aeromonas veronii]